MSRSLKMKLSQWKADWWPGWGRSQTGGGPVKAGAQMESESRDRTSGSLAGKREVCLS